MFFFSRILTLVLPLILMSCQQDEEKPQRVESEINPQLTCLGATFCMDFQLSKINPKVKASEICQSLNLETSSEDECPLHFGGGISTGTCLISEQDLSYSIRFYRGTPGFPETINEKIDCEKKGRQVNASAEWVADL